MLSVLGDAAVEEGIIPVIAQESHLPLSQLEPVTKNMIVEAELDHIKIKLKDEWKLKRLKKIKKERKN